jgi:predicted membrane-bound spermidine synthase
VRECEPRLRPDELVEAAPLTIVTGLPIVVAPSLNVMVPVALAGVTPAKSVTLWLMREGVGVAERLVVVVTWLTVCGTIAEVLPASFISPA